MKRSFRSVGGSQVDAPVKRRKAAPRYRSLKTRSIAFPGRIAAGSTTLAKYPVPFPPKLLTNLIYENGLTGYAPGGTFGTLSIINNSCFDVDQQTQFGNKQPLFWDNLTSGGGPYKKYKVISWKTTYTIVNNSATALTAYALPPIPAAAEIDSISEAENFPGVKRLYLTPSTGSMMKGTITVTGNVSDVFDASREDADLTAAYNSSPSAACYGGLCLASPDAINVACWVAIKHEMYTELTGVDVAVS